MSIGSPRIVVFTTLFPHPGQPTAGLFIRERMFRVGKSLPMVVVAPVPWFPFQRLLCKWRPHFRPDAPRREIQSGIEVLHPRFLSVPGIFKSMDGLFLAMGSLPTLWKLKKRFDFQLIDAHFAYPDGYAAMLLSRWLRIPFTVTLRGTEARLSKTFVFRRLMISALSRAARVFSVADSLKKNAVAMGIPKERILVVGNGVDGDKFQPIERYRTGDVGVLDTNTCSCGRGLPLLKDIQGRSTDFAVAQDGTVMHGLALVYILRDLPQVRGFKIIQESRNLTRVLIVPDRRGNYGLAKKIESGSRARLGGPVRIAIEGVAEIPAEKSGKYRYVVSKVEQTYAA